MNSYLCILNSDVRRRFLLLLFVMLLQCTNKYGNAFRNMPLMSSRFPAMKPPLHGKHRVTFPLGNGKTYQSPTIALMMGWDGSGYDLIPLIPPLFIVTAGSTASQTEPWVQPLANVLDPFLNFMSFAMLSRVVLSWYPEMIITNNAKNDDTPRNEESSTAATTASSTDPLESSEINTVSDALKNNSNSEKASLPIWITLIVIPTQPLLRAVKDVVPSAFGVDITPVFWLAIFTFIHEILLGQQGLFTMKIKYGI